MKSPYQSSSSVKWNCMQGQDDDASSLEDNHAHWSTPDKKVETQVGNYCLVNYEEELWPGQITKIISRSWIRVKYYKKATAHAGFTWRWPKKTDEQDYHIVGIRHKINTPEDVPGSIRNLVVRIPELDNLVVAFMDNTFLFIRYVFSRT